MLIKQRQIGKASFGEGSISSTEFSSILVFKNIIYSETKTSRQEIFLKNKLLSRNGIVDATMNEDGSNNIQIVMSASRRCWSEYLQIYNCVDSGVDRWIDVGDHESLKILYLDSLPIHDINYRADVSSQKPYGIRNRADGDGKEGERERENLLWMEQVASISKAWTSYKPRRHRKWNWKKNKK